MIKWEEKYSTGIISIDRQHRMLFEFFNDFEECIATGKGKSYLETGFPLLEAYAKAHFKFEEDCMEEQECPAAHENKEAHRAFVIKVEAIKSRFNTSKVSAETLTELHGFLEQWINTHIIGIDTQLKDCFQGG